MKKNLLVDELRKQNLNFIILKFEDFVDFVLIVHHKIFFHSYCYFNEV